MQQWVVSIACGGVRNACIALHECFTFHHRRRDACTRNHQASYARQKTKQALSNNSHKLILQGMQRNHKGMHLQLKPSPVLPALHTCALACRSRLGRICLHSRVPSNMCCDRLSGHQPCGRMRFELSCQHHPFSTYLCLHIICVRLLECRRDRTYCCCCQRSIFPWYSCLRKLIKICSKDAMEWASLHERVEQHHAFCREENCVLNIIEPCSIIESL